MSQTECATSSSNPARLCQSGTALCGQMDLVMQELWNSPSSRRKTWTTVEKKGKRGAEAKPKHTKIPKYGKLNIKIQVPDVKPAPGLADEPTEGSLRALEANLADGLPRWVAKCWVPSPSKTRRLAAACRACGSKAEAPTGSHSQGLLVSLAGLCRKRRP